MECYYIYVFKYILLIMLFIVVPVSPLYSFPLCTPTFSSCPWVIHISSLASTFPILLFTSPCLFSTYHLCYLFLVPFPHFLPSLPPFITIHVISIAVICSCSSCLLSLFLFLLFLGSVVDSHEYVVILLFIFFYLFLR